MIAMSEREFDQAVQDALAEIPDEFRPYLENVVIEVQRVPSAKLLADEDVPEDILGLYVGVPLEEQGSEYSGHLPDRVLIFRDTLCDMCETREELIDEIRVTVLHEIGHHFGLDEDRLEELGYG